MATEHPDEGTIHAWLDGELDDAESARIAAHVAGCAACSAATAEARGLIAGASRVVASLDAAAAPAVHPAASSSSRWLRVTPRRAAIAATLLVVAGLTLLRDQVAQEAAMAPPVAVRPPAAAPAPAIVPPAKRDPLLDSAIRRNVAQALPPRRLERAPGPDVVPPLAPPAPATVDTTAGLRVAEGRMEARARADSAPVAAEHAAAPLAATMTQRRTMARSANADIAPRPHCYRVEAPGPGATWGGVTLPVVVTLDGGRWRAVTDPTLTGRWTRLEGDSVRLELKGEGAVAGMVRCP